jgi:hypothetical protein
MTSLDFLLIQFPLSPAISFPFHVRKDFKESGKEAKEESADLRKANERPTIIAHSPWTSSNGTQSEIRCGSKENGRGMGSLVREFDLSGFARTSSQATLRKNMSRID